jgi:hypothetical protein
LWFWEEEKERKKTAKKGYAHVPTGPRIQIQSGERGISDDPTHASVVGNSMGKSLLGVASHP